MSEDPDGHLDPARSPGLHGPRDVADIDVGRDDVTLGEADPASFSATDTTPVADTPTVDLLDALDSDDAVDRRRAALALGDRTDPETTTPEAVVGALAESVRTDDDPEVRQFAVESLARFGGDAVGAAIRDALDDENPWVRAETVVALDRLDRAAYEDRLVAALDDDHHAVRRNAAISLHKLRGEDALDVLLELVDDPSERVREWVAHLLGSIDDDRAAAALRDLAENDPVELVRTTARQALDGASESSAPSGSPLGGEDRLNRQPDL